MNDEHDSAFKKAAVEHNDRGLVQEMWLFLRCNKKYWLLPALIVLLLFSALILASGSAAAPFIYTLF
jgi:hypothetical protein